MVGTVKVTPEDREAFIKMQKDIHGDKFEVPELNSPSPTKVSGEAPSMFAVYREAIGAPVELSLSAGRVIVAPPKVKTIKYLLAKAKSFKDISKENPLGVLGEFEKVMLQCLEFPDGVPNDIEAWFDELPGDEGMTIAEAFGQVFDMKYLMERATAIQGKK